MKKTFKSTKIELTLFLTLKNGKLEYVGLSIYIQIRRQNYTIKSEIFLQLVFMRIITSLTKVSYVFQMNFKSLIINYQRKGLFSKTFQTSITLYM